MLKYLLIFILILTFQPCVICEILTLSNYCEMFNERNNEIKALDANIHSIESKLAEIDRIYSYHLTAGANYLNDQTGQELYLINIDKLATITYSTSLNKQFKIGTQLSFGVGGFYGDYFGHKSFDDPEKMQYNDHRLYPFIHLQQSLLKNIKGASTKASIAKVKAQTKSSLYLLEYKKQTLLFNAKLSYWKLSYTKTVTKFRRISLERAKKFLVHNFKKYKLNLIDESDLLQSQAAVKLKELSLNLAIEEQNKAQITFNQLLNLDPLQEYEVENIDDKTLNLNKIEKFERKTQRLDVLSALEDIKSAAYDEQVYKKNSGADLVLNGQASISNLYRNISDSTTTIKNVSSNNVPTFSFGIKYILPLDFKLRKTIHKGYNAAKIAAGKTAKELQSKENSDWNLLLEHFNNVKDRLQIAYEIKKIQQQKTIKTKYNLQKGRGATYFVLQSEQDLDDIELNIFQCILELISIQEQTNIFYN